MEDICERFFSLFPDMKFRSVDVSERPHALIEPQKIPMNILIPTKDNIAVLNDFLAFVKENGGCGYLTNKGYPCSRKSLLRNGLVVWPRISDHEFKFLVFFFSKLFYVNVQLGTERNIISGTTAGLCLLREFGKDLNRAKVSPEEGMRMEKEVRDYYEIESICSLQRFMEKNSATQSFSFDYKTCKVRDCIHIDINKSFTAGVAEVYPFLMPHFKAVMKKYPKEKYKAIFNEGFGWFMSPYVTSRGIEQHTTSSLYFYGVYNTYHKVQKTFAKLRKAGYAIIQWRTDGGFIKQIKPNAKPLNKILDIGKGIGQWKVDQKKEDVYLCSSNWATKDDHGISGCFALSLTKPYSEWNLEDCLEAMRQSLHITKPSFDFDRFKLTYEMTKGEYKDHYRYEDVTEKIIKEGITL